MSGRGGTASRPTFGLFTGSLLVACAALAFSEYRRDDEEISNRLLERYREQKGPDAMRRKELMANKIRGPADADNVMNELVWGGKAAQFKKSDTLAEQGNKTNANRNKSSNDDDDDIISLGAAAEGDIDDDETLSDLSAGPPPPEEEQAGLSDSGTKSKSSKKKKKKRSPDGPSSPSSSSSSSSKRKRKKRSSSSTSKSSGTSSSSSGSSSYNKKKSDEGPLSDMDPQAAIMVSALAGATVAVVATLLIAGTRPKS